jgi:predicted nuclease of predicted toxin-antitoxin system
MKIKLDENLPARLKILLNQSGHDVHTTPEEGLAGCSDRDVWESVQKESRFFITQDMDFADRRRFAPGSHCGILLLRLQPMDRRGMIERIGEIFREHDTSEWPGCMVVATEMTVRVVKPPMK